MKDRSHRSLDLRKWLSTATYLDGFFALAERTRVGLRQLFTRALPATDWDWSPRRRKKRSCSLDFERLEDRRMMTTVAFSAPSYSVYDNAGSASITVDLSSSSMSTITVDYATSNGSATAGTDYTAASGTLTFAPASTSQTFSVPVTNDGITSTKTVDLTLSSPSNATLGLNNPVVLDLEPVAPTITLSPGTLPAATVGVSYSEQLSASGGTSPYTYAVTGLLGLLPAGISLSSSGLLSGTSTYTSINSFTVTATDSNGFTGNQNYTLDVNTPTITLSPSTLSAATAGTSYSQQLTGGGGDSPYTFAVTTGSLPTGISLSSGGLLSGTGTAVTSATFTVTATDHNSYTGTQSYTLAVGAPNISFTPTTLSNATAGASYSATLSGTGGTASYSSFTITAGALPAGLALSSGGTISGTPTAAGAFSFTVRAQDSTTGSGAPYTGSQGYALTVNAPNITFTPTTLSNATAGASFSQTLTAAGGTSPYSNFTITGGLLPAGFSLSSGGTLSGTATAVGSFSFTVTAQDSTTGSGAPYTGSQAYSLVVNAPNIAFTPSSLPATTVGISYTQTITASGGTSPYSNFSVSVGSLPAGVTLSSSGVLSGTPTATGTFNFTVEAQDSTTGSGAPYTGTKAYSLIVNAVPTVSPSSLPGDTIYITYYQTLTASGGTGTDTFAVSNIANAIAGLSVPSSSTGTLNVTGIPTATGTETFDVVVTDSLGVASATLVYSITVNSPPTVTPAWLPDGTVGVAYSQTLTASGGTGTKTFAVSAITGAIAGLTVPTSGTGTLTISGTPTATGTETFHVVVTDAVGATSGTLDYSVAVFLTPPATYTPTVTNLGTDPNAQTSAFGPYQVNLLTGNLNIEVAALQADDPLEQAELYYYPGLVYNSDTANPQPLIGVALQTYSGDPLPTTVDATLTWNAGTPDSTVQSTIVFVPPSGATAGESFNLSLQVASPVTTTGLYNYSVDVVANYGGGRAPIEHIITGSATVIVNGPTYGAGWSLPDVNSLVFVGTGANPNVLLVYGDGGSSYFTYASGTYTGPANDPGTLTKSGSNYLYTRPDQTVWTYNSTGQLVTVTGPTGNDVTYSYSGSAVASIADDDGNSTAFDYSGGDLDATVREASGTPYATMTETESLGDLNVITDAVGDPRTFTYDSSNKLLEDNYGGVEYDFAYTDGAVSSASPGALATSTVVPQLLEGFGSVPLVTATLAVAQASVTDGNGVANLYGLDAYGRELTHTLPSGVTETYVRNTAGLPTSYTDPAGNTTGTTYYPGTQNVKTIVTADGTTSFTYDSTFNQVATITDPMGNVTTNVIDGTTGEIDVTIDPLGNRTTNTWSGGLLQTVTNPLGTVTSYLYDSYGRPQTIIDPLGNRTTYTMNVTALSVTVENPDGVLATTLYDKVGRESVSIDGLGLRTTYIYTASGELVTTLQPGQANGTTIYNAAGQVSATEDALDNLSETVYDGAGNVIATVDPYGNRTTTIFDSYGRPIATEDFLGNFTTTVFNPAGQVIATVDPYGNHTSFVYDSMGRQIATEDYLGNWTSTVYNADGQVSATIDMYGNRTTSIYDAAGHVIATVDPFGNRATSVFNAAGQVVATIDQFGNITTNIYDAAGNQIATEDYLGNFTTTVFDGAGNVIATIDPYGNHTTFIFNSYGQQVAIEDQYGHFTTTVFDSEGRVSATIDVYGNRTTTIYDSYGRVSATIDYLGNATTTIYDGVGNVLATVDALGNRTTNIYDSFGLQIATEDPNGNFTTTVFDSYGNPIATIDPLGNRTTTVLDSHGREAATIDPLGNRTSTIFDSYGRVSATEDALGHYVTSIFNSYGQVSATIDPLGNRTTNIFDSTGRQVATEDALGNFTTTVFDSYGRPVATIDPLGNRVTSVYDSHGNVVATIDGLGNATTTVFDSEGRAAATIDPLGNRTTNIFDAYGRLAAVENPLGNLVSNIYDSYGRQVATEDALGHFTTTIFDSYGRPVATIDPLGNRTTTVLDSQGRTVGEIDASGNVTTFVLDALGRVVQTITPLGTTTSTYDADGRLATQTDALGQEILYGYDAVGNDLTQTWKNAGGSVANLLTFTYDADGRQLTASNNVGTYTIAYNNVGEATSVQGLWGVLLTMTYDSAGNRTLVQDSFGGVTSGVFDADGNLTQEETGGTGLTPMRINLGYNADGELTGETRFSNLAGTVTVATASIVYDSTGDVTGQLDKTGGGTNIANYTNVYDANREITSEQLNGGTPTSFTYDDDGEVTGDGSITESYGATRNRTNTGDTTGTDNELTSDGTWNYSYDLDGDETEKINIATGVAWTYGYDDKKELVKAQEWSMNPYVYGTAYVEVEVDYKYDAWGNLAETDSYPTGSGSPAVTRYAVDGWNPALAGTTGNTRFNVWADLDGSNNLQTRYLRGNTPDQLFGRVDNAGNAYWTLTDRQGSVRDVIDNSGNVKDALNFDAFGNIISETNSAYRGSYAWTGRLFDVETDLQYNNARWYDPATGRWQSQDPLGFDAGDSNLYRYVNNDPTNATDPSGLWLFASNEAVAKDMQAWLANDPAQSLVMKGLKGPGIKTTLSKWDNGSWQLTPSNLQDVENAITKSKNGWASRVLGSLMTQFSSVEVDSDALKRLPPEWSSKIPQYYANISAGLSPQTQLYLAAITAFPLQQVDYPLSRIGGANTLVILGLSERSDFKLLNFAEKRGSIATTAGDWNALIKAITTSVKENDGKRFDRIIIMGHGAGSRMIPPRIGPGVGLGISKEKAGIPTPENPIPAPTFEEQLNGRFDSTSLDNNPGDVATIRNALTANGYLELVACGSCAALGDSWFNELQGMATLLQRPVVASPVSVTPNSATGYVNLRNNGHFITRFPK